MSGALADSVAPAGDSRASFRSTSRSAVAGVFVGTIFLNAFLLFLLEPMFGKLALPHLGGSAAVWTTCMLFFQIALLVGYLYAHALATRVPPRAQVVIHFGLLALAASTLPVRIPGDWAPHSDSQPAVALLGLMTLRIGAVFVLLAAGSPLLQHWLARAPRMRHRDPYSLYVASNLGSLVALLGYPFLIEPWITLAGQTRVWTFVYLALVLLTLLCGLYTGGRVRSATATESASVGVSWRERTLWTALAAVPSSLLLAVTTHITTNLAPVPLLWVAPLALYLLTFVIAFSERRRFASAAVSVALPYSVVAVAALFFLRSEVPGLLGYGVHIVTFFICALACHLRLVAARPAPSRLTEFYVWLAVGGAIGGFFNVLVAPHIFDTVVEYPIALVAAAALSAPTRPDRRLIIDLVSPTALALLLGVTGAIATRSVHAPGRVTLAVVLIVGAIAAYSFRHRPLRFALAVAAITGEGAMLGRAHARPLVSARSFYGVYKIVDDTAAGLRQFYSGTTIHGSEFLNDTAHVPLAYYHRDGPLGSVFASRSWLDRPWRVGVVGLGAGAAAAYARPGESWTFFELDPLVARIAGDARIFHFISSSKAQQRIVLGDARLSLEREPLSAFDVLIIDAFSSDAIPTHLLTREALELYRSRLASDGIIAWHISNNYLDLRPVLKSLVEDAGLIALINADLRVPATAGGRLPSIWVVMTATARTANAFRLDSRWTPLHGNKKELRLWTDDFSNVFSVIRR